MNRTPTISIYCGKNYQAFRKDADEIVKLIEPYSKTFSSIKTNDLLSSLENDVKTMAMILIDDTNPLYNLDINRVVNKLLSLTNETSRETAASSSDAHERHCNFIIITRQKLTKTFARNPKIKIIF